MNQSRLGAYGILIDGPNILLIKKQTGPYKGLWDLPGGKIEFGETIYDALKREIEEEVGMKCEDVEWFENLTHTGQYKDKNGPTSLHHVGLIYRIQSFSPITGAKPDEISEWMFLPKLELSALTPFASEVVKWHKNRLSSFGEF